MPDYLLTEYFEHILYLIDVGGMTIASVARALGKDRKTITQNYRKASKMGLKPNLSHNFNTLDIKLEERKKLIDDITHLRDVKKMTFEKIGLIYGKPANRIREIYISQSPKVVKQLPATPKVVVPHKYQHLIDEPINRGKSYADYLREQGIKRAPECS